MKRLLLIPCLLLTSLVASAQEKGNWFNHMDLSFTAGSTGLGFDLSMPAGEYLRVRTGGTFMPRFEHKMQFNVQLVNTKQEVDKELASERFDNMKNFMKGFMGLDMSDHVDMMGSPRFNNFKMLVDVTPFKKKNWHATVGFYLGSKKVATAYNTSEGMVSLLSVKMYNEMYWRCMNEQPMIEYDNDKTNMHVSADFHPMIRSGFEAYGTMSMRVGYFKEDYYAKQDILWDHDVYELDMEEDSPTQYEMVCRHKRGEVRFQKGELAYQKGDAYYMLPEQETNTIKVDAFANRFRPYLGLGYSGALSKDKRSQISVDMGAMFWGGVPKVITHDGIDLTRDLYNLDGQVKRYVNIAQKFSVFPVVELRFSQRIF